MPIAVVTGANSGVGHAFAQICIRNGYETYAVDINHGDALESLKGPNCHICQLDVSSESSIVAFVKELGDRPVDLLLNIAGIVRSREMESLGAITFDTLERIFAVNTYGPLMLTQALLPNLLKSHQARVATMSSRVGSISDNSSGGQYAYRASKTAVNSLFKNLSIDLKDKGIIVLLIHPGIVNSNMGRSLGVAEGAVEPEEAAGKLWPIVLGKGLDKTGTFWHREGWEIPW